jgi:uncharacterized membrane protein
MNRFVAPLTLAGIGLAGVGVSVYLTDVHYAKAPLVCSTNGIVNCERVLSSGYSTVAGVPLSVGGIVWFAVTLLLASLALVRRPEPGWLQPAQVLWGLLGLATVLYLVGVEAVALGVICAWCTALHVLIVTSLLIALFRRPAEEPERDAAPAETRSRGRAAAR